MWIRPKNLAVLQKVTKPVFRFVLDRSLARDPVLICGAAFVVNVKKTFFGGCQFNIMKPLFVLWVFAASYVGAHENIVISTPQGEIDGLADTARDGDKFYAFRGVPFAQPPTGEFRYF